ncbi:DUF1517 domain-containing protein [Sandaracinus amylolyticus]|uniref:Uncharacterized protein n=1 Tax=Sandaracinus amylolyticus TaxID=927083 RepID=A0A0F6YM08_9BACT|nr:DUF1517 domain-containing protein [Sandaracinus amylolyticus]AKF09760.1 hypothetical protein DB32_006909 [Sandaracinus amylolyticus]
MIFGALLSLSLLLVGAFAEAAIAEAQRTGGSFGGRRWSGGGRGRAPIGSSYRGTRYGGGGYYGPAPFVFFAPGGIGAGGLVTLVVIGGVVMLLARGARRATLRVPGPQSRAWDNVDLGVVQIGVDAETRRAIEETLAARRVPLRVREHGATWLREVIHELRARRDAWLAVRVDDYRPMSPPMAAGSFRRVQEDAQHGAPLAEHDGELEVVTIAVASHREIVDVQRDDADAAERVMRALAQLDPDEIVALDVRWAAPA